MEERNEEEVLNMAEGEEKESPPFVFTMLQFFTLLDGESCGRRGVGGGGP